MSDETKNLEFDLDEDLFDFGEASLADVFDGEDDADLDEIFAAFQEAHVVGEADDAEEDGEDEGDLLDDFFVEEEDEEALEEAPVAQVWTPESVLDQPELTPRTKRKKHKKPKAASRTQGASTVVASTGFSRAALWVFVGITSLNALVALVTLQSMATMRSGVAEVGRHVTATADEIRSGSYEQARVLNELQTPVVPIDPEEHPTFDRARAEIAKGQYTQARRRLYALLSIIDRLDPEQRARVESRAQYLLAEALHLEALERMEAEQ